ncbi:hypothetical protein Pla108_27020 [Botrimarina colliarenosi]|uniref:Uncharacterized protein n=1 Tax=Botrimarina colliarenosi TaxID=2528001 RepID=A0A5C6ABZ3_9BACT|nr:hypothetical protein [Botrimarina colliarenosi]TWT96926.1 hypothetical protein Pla108_27020 [Botrimarina colliarenosi]
MVALCFRRVRQLLWWCLHQSLFVLCEVTTLQVLFLTPAVLTLLWLPTLFEPQQSSADDNQQTQASHSAPTLTDILHIFQPPNSDCEPNHVANP